MRDRFRGPRLCQAVTHRPIEMIGNLSDLAGRDERADRDEAPVARREVGTQPQVAEQNVGGVLDNARRHLAELLADARGAIRLGRLVQRQKRRRGRGELIGADAARGKDI
jgi:hypothetical protein